MRGVGWRAVVVASVLVLAGCTSGAGDEPTRERTVTSTQTRTSTVPSGSFTPPAPSFVRPLRPGQKPHRGEKEQRCPYIRTGVDQEQTRKPNVADIQGNRIYRTTVLTDLNPVGCRFYFYSAPFEAVADIVPRTFATATEAYNAMVKTAQTGTGLQSRKDFVDGVDGISFRTKFFAQDGARDWAFVFAKGTTMVVVHTEEKTTALNALNLARAIVAKF